MSDMFIYVNIMVSKLHKQPFATILSSLESLAVEL